MPGKACMAACLLALAALCVVARPGSREGERYVQFVLGPAGKRILKRHGFD